TAVLFPVEHSRLAPRGSWNTPHVCSFTFLKEPIHYCCSLDPRTLKMTRWGVPCHTRGAGAGGLGPRAGHSFCPDPQKWCYPAHAWALEPGLLQVFLALTENMLHLEPLHTLTQEPALEG
ncbi:hypothetical protein DBR06_SOUSAS6910308, partial [Sousa chinensis]